MRAKKRMIVAKLTPDANINRKALPPKVIEIANHLRDLGVPVQLLQLRVEQGSIHAERIAKAQREYDAIQCDN